MKAKADFEKALSLSPDLDAGLAKPAQAKARAELANLAKLEIEQVERAQAAAEAEDRAAREKAVAEAAAKTARAKAAAEAEAEAARRKAAAEAEAKAAREKAATEAEAKAARAKEAAEVEAKAAREKATAEAAAKAARAKAAAEAASEAARVKAAAVAEAKAARDMAAAEAHAEAARVRAATVAEAEAARAKAAAEAQAKAERDNAAAATQAEAARVRTLAEAEAKAARDKAIAEAQAEAARVRAATEVEAKAARDKAAAETQAEAVQVKAAAEAEAKAARAKAAAEAEVEAARIKAAADAEAKAARDKVVAEAQAEAARIKAAAEAEAKAAREKVTTEAAAEAARAKPKLEIAATEEPSPARELPPAPPIPVDIRQDLRKRGHALLIGVSHYTGGWDQLASVNKDLQDLQEGLQPYFQTVESVSSPTVVDLKRKLEAFLLRDWKGPKERLFIYYSGHGFTDFNQASQRLDGYITGSDTPPYDPKDVTKATDNALSFYDVDSWNRKTKAKHVLMVFDACFSGSLFNSKGTVPQQIDHAGIRRTLTKAIRYYITAGRANDEVAADGIFAKLLLRGLRGEADVHHEGIISADDLGSYLFHAVHRYSDRQTPQYGSIADPTLSDGQFFFLTEPAAAGTNAPLAGAPTDIPTGKTPGTLIKSKLK